MVFLFVCLLVKSGVRVFFLFVRIFVESCVRILLSFVGVFPVAGIWVFLFLLWILIESCVRILLFPMFLFERFCRGFFLQILPRIGIDLLQHFLLGFLFELVLAVRVLLLGAFPLIQILFLFLSIPILLFLAFISAVVFATWRDVFDAPTIRINELSPRWRVQRWRVFFGGKRRITLCAPELSSSEEKPRIRRFRRPQAARI
jgi:hypothetical protein